jgi:thiol-disulfide isomerase/thioredoxin
MDTSLFFGVPGDTAVLWFDPDTYLLRSIRVDFLENFISQRQLPESSEGQAYIALEMIEAMTAIKTGGGLLTFNPRPQDQEVEQLSPPADNFESASIMETVGQAASPISADTLSGEEFSLSSLQGDVVLLDFWASWCGYCMQSRPAIKSIGEQFSQHDLQIVSISLDDEGDREIVERIADSSGIRAIEIHDYANAISTDYRVDVTPTFVLLNQSGTIEHVTMGPLLDKNLAELQARISSLLEI